MRLYNKILEYKITPNSFIYSIVGKIVQKMSDCSEFVDIKSKDISNFPRRTFRSENETKILGDKIVFNCLQNCPDCNKLINVENLSRNYKKMKKDLCWAKCPYCNYIKPEISLNFGQSISSIFSNVSSSKIEKFTLCSPYELKNNLKEIVDKDQFHLLDIDKFKINFPNLFWSCIWFFNLYDLDYNIILPYEVNVLKQKSNNNKRIFTLNSKIISSLKKNNYIVSLMETTYNKNNNNPHNQDFIRQNVISFCYKNNIYCDYFGIFKKSNINENQSSNDYLKNRQKTFIKIKNKNTISGFLFSGGDKKLSDKNINKFIDKQNINNNKTPNFKTKKQGNKVLTDIKLEKRFSEPINNVNEDINDLKPFFVLKKANIINNKNNSPESNSSFSLEENN